MDMCRGRRADKVVRHAGVVGIAEHCGKQAWSAYLPKIGIELGVFRSRGRAVAELLRYAERKYGERKPPETVPTVQPPTQQPPRPPSFARARGLTVYTFRTRRGQKHF